MLKRHMMFTVIFLTIASVNFFAASNLVQGLIFFVKPLICISLAIYLVRNVNMSAGFNRLALAALILSSFGDFFLLFSNGSIYFFVYGLVAFLLAHVFYSFAFFRDFKNDPQGAKIYGHLMLFVMGVFSLTYYSIIRAYLSDLKIPVMAYMFVISIMAILAGYRYKRVNGLSFKLIYFGAVCFVISDSILAYNKFVEPFNYSGILIIGTYMLAQYLIIMGAIERVVLARDTRLGDR